MRIGVIGTAYNCAGYLDSALRAWGQNREDELIFSFIHSCFKENYELGAPIHSEDSTWEILEDWGLADSLMFSSVPLTEIEARNLCLNFLLSQKVDYVWSIGMDELYTPKEIEGILDFIRCIGDTTPHYFKINFKNYVFGKKTWIDGFCPPRIFSARNIGEFYEDDGVFYKGNNVISYKNFPCIEVPREVAHVRHMTWLNNLKSKQKILYQEKRWGKDGCSYKWDEENQMVRFNEKYYEKIGEKPPIINYDE